MRSRSVRCSVTPAAAAVSGAETAPKIVTIATSPAVAHTGDVVNWTVLTTPDVSAVSARVTTYTIALRRMAPGHFAVTFSIPHNVPALFHGRYTVNLTASTPGGKSAHGSFVLDFQ